MTFNCNRFARKAAEFRGIVDKQTCQEAWIVHKCDNDLTSAKKLWVEGNMGETGHLEWTDDFKGELWAWSTVDTGDCEIPLTKAMTSCHGIVFCVFVLSMLIGFVLRGPRSTSSEDSDDSLKNIKDNRLDSNFMV